MILRILGGLRTHLHITCCPILSDLLVTSELSEYCFLVKHITNPLLVPDFLIDCRARQLSAQLSEATLQLTLKRSIKISTRPSQPHRLRRLVLFLASKSHASIGMKRIELRRKRHFACLEGLWHDGG